MYTKLSDEFFRTEIAEKVNKEMDRLNNSGACSETTLLHTVLYVALKNVAESYAPNTKEHKKDARNLLTF